MYLIYFFQFIYYVIYMNKIKKFKKSKKTNNKRNHKRRLMTRKLRGGVIKPDWPLDKETPPQPLNGTSQPIVVSDKPMVVQPVVVSEKPEPSKEIQSLEDRTNEIEESEEDDDMLSIESGWLKQLKYDVDWLKRKVSGESSMVPLLFKLGTNEVIFINKNITEFTVQNIPIPNIQYDNYGNPNYSPYMIDLYQLLKFLRLRKIDLNIIVLFNIILRPGVDVNGMPNMFSGTIRDKIRIVYNFFENFKKYFSTQIKFIYRSFTRRDSPPIEYDLAGLKSILSRERLLSPEREPNGESSSGEEVEVEVFPWKYKDKKYLKTSDNRVYDIKTQKRIGKWNMNTNQIEPLSESSDDSE